MRQLFYFCLAIVLGFLGVVSPVILPTGLTAREQEVLAKNAKLSFFKPLEQKNAEVNGISITIPIIDPFVLPIPKKQPNTSTPIQLRAVIDNNRQTPVRLHQSYFLIPELVKSNGQALSPKLAPNQSGTALPPNCKSIEPGGDLFPSTEARLFWKNNQLQFAGSDYLGNRWSFGNLEPGTYQLRLKYFHPDGETSCLNRKTQKIEPLEVDELVTPFVTLHLVEHVSPASNAIEIDGVGFETVVSPRILTIPSQQSDAKIPVRFGLIITNNTSQIFRLNWCCLLWPELRGADSKPLQGYGLRTGGLPTEDSTFPLAFPGEEVNYFLDGTLSWQHGSLVLTGPDGLGGQWRFEDLGTGNYQVRFVYIGAITEIDLSDIHEIRRLTGFWTGEVVTPLVEVDLVSIAN